MIGFEYFMFGSTYVLFECSVRERGESFQLPKKKVAVNKVFALVKLQGSTCLTGMGLNIRHYAALAAIKVWLPLTISFSISLRIRLTVWVLFPSSDVVSASAMNSYATRCY